MECKVCGREFHFGETYDSIISHLFDCIGDLTLKLKEINASFDLGVGEDK